MRWLLVFLLVNVGAQLSAEPLIGGKWYRNVPFAEATLKVGPGLHFHVEASYAANFGELDGTLHPIRQGLYYGVVDDKGLGQSCLIVVSVENGRLSITLYGDEIGAGAGVYYQGEYARKPMSEAQFRREALNRILPKGLKQESVTHALGDNLDYFIECFAVTSSIPSQDSDIRVAYEGYAPGVANSENGIIAIGSGRFYILFQDSRKQRTTFQYFTNAPAGAPLPRTFRHWIGGRTGIPLVRHHTTPQDG